MRTGDNLTQWREGQRGHVESYFIKFNDVQQGVAVWIKFTIEAPLSDGRCDNPSGVVGECWAIVFNAQDPERTEAWKAVYPITRCRLARDRWMIEMGPNRLADGLCEGVLEKESGMIRWQLTFTEGEAPLHLFPYRWMYEGRFPKSKLKTPYPASRFSGVVRVRDRTYTFDSVPGMQGHNWGAEHAPRYAWSHCSSFSGEPEDTFFEGFSGRTRIGPWTTPYLTMAALSWRGRRILWNDIFTALTTRVSVSADSWRFHLRGGKYHLSGTVSAPEERWIALQYRNPDGRLLYCLNSKIASCTLELTAGGRTLALLRSDAAALEILTDQKPSGVRLGV